MEEMDYSSLRDCSPVDREELFEPLRNPILAAENAKTRPLGYCDSDMVAKSSLEVQGIVSPCPQLDGAINLWLHHPNTQVMSRGKFR